MKMTALLLVGAIVLLAGPDPIVAAPPPGFTALFNGADLAGWRGGITFDHRELLALPPAKRTARIEQWTRTLIEKNPLTDRPHWHVEHGELVNDGLGGYATTERDYGDFELVLEYKIAPLTDSGIYLRGVPQVQIWDPHRPDPKHNGNARGSGGLWNNAEDSPGKYPLVVADRSIGQWNHIRIVMTGEYVSVWLNQHLVVDHSILENYFDRNLPPEQRRPVPSRGPIQLQTHGGEIRWRHIFIREIESSEVTRILQQEK